MNKNYFKWSAVIIIALLITVMIVYLLLAWPDNPQNLASIVTIIGLIAIAAKYFISDYYGYKNLNIRKEEAKNSLNSIVTNLSAEDNTSKLSAAIMLRRFLDSKTSVDFPYLKKETINVISSMLKILPTGVFQKTLADGLAYATDLSNVDLQRTNLQDTYLGRKDETRILLNETDMFLSDLSYALIEHVNGKAIFYRSILFCAQIKNCDFSGATFREADLTNVCFKNVTLKDADFAEAVNVPEAIKKELIEKDGKRIYPHADPVTAKHSSLDKSIFFSMPSVMNKENELLTKDYKTYLEGLGYKVIYYIKDDYPCFGQLNRIREKILVSSAMVAFGFKQTNIHDATYRPETNNEEKWNNKWLSTPWNEIEVGMGLMKGMPILLVKDPMIDMGIFDNNLSECFVAKVSTDDDSRKLSQNKEVVKWLSKITL